MEKEEIVKLIDEKILSAINSLKEEIINEKEAVINIKQNSDAKTISLQEFIDEKNPKKTASEEMPVIAYFLKNIDKRRIGEINDSILKFAYGSTNRVRPKRIKQAFIDSPCFSNVSGKAGFYKLNDNGDYLVEVSLEKKNKK